MLRPMSGEISVVSRQTFRAPAELNSAITRLAKPQLIRAGEVLFRRGDRVKGVYLIQAGRVQLSVGAYGATWTAEPGSLLGLPATVRDSDYSLTAVAVEDTVVAFAENRLVRKVLESDASLCFQAVEILSGELQWLRDQ